MKIVLTAKGKEASSPVDERFGRAEYFILYDDAAQTYSVINNPGQYENSGAGVKASQIVIDAGAEVVITGSLGPKAFMVLRDAGIRGYQNHPGTLEEMVVAFKEEKLQELLTPGEEVKTRGRS
jgi:predicted Fe-Mo cluster-binding NifX family protein